MVKTNIKKRKQLDMYCIEYIEKVKKELKELGIKKVSSNDALKFIINQNAGFNNLVNIKRAPKKKKEFIIQL